MNKRQMRDEMFAWFVIGLYWLSMFTLLWIGRHDRSWVFWVAVASVGLVLFSSVSSKRKSLGEVVMMITLAGGILYSCVS